MAVEESIVSKKYRILVDAANRRWARISFWTQAKDVFNTAGDNLESTVGWIKGKAADKNDKREGYLPDAKVVNDRIESVYSEITQSMEDTNDAIFYFGTTPMQNGDPLADKHFYWQYKE